MERLLAPGRFAQVPWWIDFTSLRSNLLCKAVRQVNVDPHKNGV